MRAGRTARGGAYSEGRGAALKSTHYGEGAGPGQVVGLRGGAGLRGAGRALRGGAGRWGRDLTLRGEAGWGVGPTMRGGARRGVKTGHYGEGAGPRREIALRVEAGLGRETCDEGPDGVLEAGLTVRGGVRRAVKWDTLGRGRDLGGRWS